MVAHWYRAQVPADQALAFFDREYTAQVDLTIYTTVDQLQASFTQG